jgi:hypothetical protein
MRRVSKGEQKLRRERISSITDVGTMQKMKCHNRKSRCVGIAEFEAAAIKACDIVDGCALRKGTLLEST